MKYAKRFDIRFMQYDYMTRCVCRRNLTVYCEWRSVAEFSLGPGRRRGQPIITSRCNMVIGPKMVQAPGRALHRLEGHLCIRIYAGL